MFNSSQFAQACNVPVELSPEMTEFALFDVALTGDCEDVQSQGLWAIEPTKGETRTELLNTVAVEREQKRQVNLAKYIEQGYAFEETE